MALKAVAVYRDGHKRTGPLDTSKEKEKKTEKIVKEAGCHAASLPDERCLVTHKFDIAGYEGWTTAGVYEDGQATRDLHRHVTMSKEGSTISGLLDSFAPISWTVK